MSTRFTRQQKAFLDHFSQNCNITAAAERAGVCRKTTYNWRKADPAFLEAYLEAEAEGWDRLEHAARQEAMPHDVEIEEMGIVTDRLGNPVMDLSTGLPRMLVTKRIKKRECNPILMMFLLKSHDPARYRERYDVQHSGPGVGQSRWN